MVKKKENNISNVWDKCKHTPKSTQFIEDKSDGSKYEVCFVCNISRRIK